MVEPLNKVVAIHQPNFFPWLGYFDKIAKSDAFILLDDAQFPKKGGSWSNRVSVLVNGKRTWLSAPVDRSYSGVRAVNEMAFDSSKDWRKKLIKTIECSYSKHPFFEEVFDLLKGLIDNKDNNLSSYNIDAIYTVCDKLNLDASKITLSSEYCVDELSNERLVALISKVHGDVYLCGGGADGYHDDAVYQRNGILVLKQQYSPASYSQKGISEFEPGLSIIDAAMNLGWDATAGLLRDS